MVICRSCLKKINGNEPMTVDFMICPDGCLLATFYHESCFRKLPYVVDYPI